MPGVIYLDSNGYREMCAAVDIELGGGVTKVAYWRTNELFLEDYANKVGIFSEDDLSVETNVHLADFYIRNSLIRSCFGYLHGLKEVSSLLKKYSLFDRYICEILSRGFPGHKEFDDFFDEVIDSMSIDVAKCAIDCSFLDKCIIDKIESKLKADSAKNLKAICSTQPCASLAL